MDEEIRKQMYMEIAGQFFEQSDTFFTKRWGKTKSSEHFTEEERNEAYHTFYKKVKKDNVASRQTIQHWFGINGTSIPRRWQIFQIAFSLQFDLSELEDYLQNGISEPGVQVNDYTEFIAMYCLTHKLDYETCSDMIDFYEQQVDMDVEIRQTAHTEKLVHVFGEIKEFSKKDFLVWMCKNAELFKGYSKNIFSCFQLLMNEALQFYRAEVKDSLMLMLGEVGFHIWAAENDIAPQNYRMGIQKFLKNISRRKNASITEEMLRDIRACYILAYASRERACDLLQSMYSSIDYEHCGISPELGTQMKHDLGTVNAKYVSELLSIAVQKERQMKMKWELAKLSHTDDKAKAILTKKLRAQDQRVRNIGRHDLLILIQYVAQKRYQKRCDETGDDAAGDYVKEDARNEFIKATNVILSSCGMRTINEQYRLDYILLNCFAEDDMFLFFEVFEK